MSRGKDAGEDPMERALRRIGAWLEQEEEAGREHPDDVSFAAYVGWLADGAPGPCPVPAVGKHAAGCAPCYAKAEVLASAHLRAAREAERVPLGQFLLRLAERAEDAALEWVDRVGNRVREPLVTYGAGLPLAQPSLCEPAGPPALSVPEGRLLLLLPGVRARASLRRDGGEYHLTLTLIDARTSQPAEECLVRLTRADGSTLAALRTDAHGRALFPSLSPQEYRVLITRE